MEDGKGAKFMKKKDPGEVGTANKSGRRLPNSQQSNCVAVGTYLHSKILHLLTLILPPSPLPFYPHDINLILGFGRYLRFWIRVYALSLFG